MRFETAAVRAGQEPEPTTGAVTIPVYQTSTFAQDGPGQPRSEYEYTRTGNPNRTALEKCLAALEGGKYGVSFASGLAATASVMACFSEGDHIICGHDVYGGTIRLFNRVLSRLGLEVSFVDLRNLDNLRKAICENTVALWMESPTNPLMQVVDIAGAVEICKPHKIWVMVDNTFATPYFQRPLELGADLVMHSTTKYLNGHADIIGGAVVLNHDDLYEQVKFHQNAIGAVPAPFDCWLVLRGIKTLPLRMQRHWENAQAIAEFLEKHPAVARVYYPGLKGNPQYELARRQMSGFSGMLSFEIAGGLEAAKRFLAGLKYFTLAESLGSAVSLIEHPGLMSHASIPPERQRELGISEALIRVSVGLEHKDDLLEDLEQALGAAG